MIWNEMPNSLKNIPKKIFRKKLKGASLDILKTIDNYIDNDKITANLKEYWRLCLLFLISRYLSYHNYSIFCPFLLFFFLNLILSHITSWNLSTVCDDSHKGSFFEFPYVLVFWTFGPKLHKDSNVLKHRLLLLSFTTLLLLIFFSLFICYSYPSLSVFSSFGLLDQLSWSFLHLLWCQLLDGGG